MGEHAADVAEMSLMPSGGGVFEVIVDGALVFSKKALGRHAEDGEVLPLVSAELAG